MSTTNLKPLQGFTKLSSTVHLYRPSSAASAGSATPASSVSDTKAVSLIVLCTWLGAHEKHISKYARTYQQLHPTASILILQSTLPDVVYRSDASQKEDLEFACNIVYNQYHRAESFVLLHVFSNGGSNTATQLACTLAPRKKSPGPCFDGVVLDSCPGRVEGSYWRAVKAISVSLPKNAVFKLFGTLIVHLLLVALFVAEKLFGVQGAVGQARRRLNNQKLFASNVPRLYIYSKVDEMVSWEDIHDHAEEARTKGYKDVTELVFEKSRHCAHVMDDERGYWGAVKRITDGGR